MLKPKSHSYTGKLVTERLSGSNPRERRDNQVRGRDCLDGESNTESASHFSKILLSGLVGKYSTEFNQSLEIPNIIIQQK